MDTQEIMQIALDLAKMDKVPEDSAIHVHGKDIRRALMCIDVEQATVSLARELGCDAIITHHPIGKAYINFYKVLDRHIEFMLNAGIERSIAEEALKELKERVELRAHTSIYSHIVAYAEKVKMPLINIHLPCDELMRQEILARLNSSKIYRVKDIAESVEQIDEFKHAYTRVKVVHGSEDARVNRYMLVVAAGTNGGYSIAKAYFDNGYDTVIYLHISPEDLARIKASNLGNLVILGHLAGDSLGMNRLSDELVKRGLEVVKLGIIE